MSTVTGFNPMAYNCETQGCFNLMRRPKIEVFSECFPGRIAMGDVDGIVEINSHGLLLEWKSGDVDLKVGQRIMYSRLTRHARLSVIVVQGDAQTMRVSRYAWFAEGILHEWNNATLDDVKQQMRDWARWAAGARLGAGR